VKKKTKTLMGGKEEGTACQRKKGRGLFSEWDGETRLVLRRRRSSNHRGEGKATFPFYSDGKGERGKRMTITRRVTTISVKQKNPKVSLEAKQGREGNRNFQGK